MGRVLPGVMVCAVAGILAGCAAPKAGPEAARVEGFVVSARDEITIELPENPTTGFQWTVVQAPAEEIMTIESSEFMPPSSELLGAGGRRLYRLRAQAPGETQLILEYRRPWEEDAEPADRKQYSFLVK